MSVFTVQRRRSCFVCLSRAARPFSPFRLLSSRQLARMELTSPPPPPLVSSFLCSALSRHLCSEPLKSEEAPAAEDAEAPVAEGAEGAEGAVVEEAAEPPAPAEPEKVKGGQKWGKRGFGVGGGRGEDSFCPAPCWSGAVCCCSVLCQPGLRHLSAGLSCVRPTMTGMCGFLCVDHGVFLSLGFLIRQPACLLACRPLLRLLLRGHLCGGG